MIVDTHAHMLENATYAQHLAVFTEELGLSAAEQEQVLGKRPCGCFFSTAKEVVL